MNVKYEAEADILIFIPREGFPINAISEPGGIIVSYDEIEDPLALKLSTPPNVSYLTHKIDN